MYYHRLSGEQGKISAVELAPTEVCSHRLVSSLEHWYIRCLRHMLEVCTVFCTAISCFAYVVCYTGYEDIYVHMYYHRPREKGKETKKCSDTVLW